MSQISWIRINSIISPWEHLAWIRQATFEEYGPGVKTKQVSNLNEAYHTASLDYTLYCVHC